MEAEAAETNADLEVKVQRQQGCGFQATTTLSKQKGMLCVIQ